MDELAMVVPRDILFAGGLAFEGFSPLSRFDFRERILSSHHYLFRHIAAGGQPIPAEQDARYKQIIPYCLFVHGDRIFLYQRLRKGGEKRLHDLYSLGIGGHINPPATAPAGSIGDAPDVLVANMLREFREEVRYEDSFWWEPLGFINIDEEEDVHKVHFGIVFLLHGTTEAIAVREKENLKGALVPLGEMLGHRPNMERWSAACADYLAENPESLRRRKTAKAMSVRSPASDQTR